MVDVNETLKRYCIAEFIRQRFQIPERCKIQPAIPFNAGGGYTVFEVIEKFSDGSENLKRYSIERCLLSEIITLPK